MPSPARGNWRYAGAELKGGEIGHDTTRNRLVFNAPILPSHLSGHLLRGLGACMAPHNAYPPLYITRRPLTLPPHRKPAFPFPPSTPLRLRSHMSISVYVSKRSRSVPPSSAFTRPRVQFPPFSVRLVVMGLERHCSASLLAGFLFSWQSAFPLFVVVAVIVLIVHYQTFLPYGPARSKIASSLPRQTPSLLLPPSCHSRPSHPSSHGTFCWKDGGS